MVRNGYLVATQGNGTLDAQWPTCVGCAILSRSLERTKTKVPDACTKCFQSYCWNGTVKSEKPPAYNPELILPNFKATTPGNSGKGSKKNAAVGTVVPTAFTLAVAWAVAALTMF
jgi:lysophospholipase